MERGRRVAGPLVAIQNCIVTQKPMSRALHVVSLAHSAAPYRDTKGLPPVTIQKLYRDPEPMPRARSRPYRRPCRGALLVVSGPPWRAPSCPVSRYNLLYRDPTPKWAVAHSSSLHTFFFTHFFFFCFSSVLLTARSQKKNKNKKNKK